MDKANTKALKMGFATSPGKSWTTAKRKGWRGKCNESGPEKKAQDFLAWLVKHKYETRGLFYVDGEYSITYRKPEYNFIPEAHSWEV